MKGVWGEPGFPQGGLGLCPQGARSAQRGFGGLPPKRAPARPGVWGEAPLGVLRGLAPLKRSQGASPDYLPPSRGKGGSGGVGDSRLRTIKIRGSHIPLMQSQGLRGAPPLTPPPPTTNKFTEISPFRMKKAE